MNHNYIDFDSQQDLIEGIILRKLTIHKDDSGTLVETLRTDWPDVNGNGSFAMQYVSTTPPNLARDEHQWHVHKFQKDRFVVISGRIVTAVYDPRNTKTHGFLNLFVMGPDKVAEMYMLVIPEHTYHGFLVVSGDSGYLLNFPTKLYNPQDEGRIENRELSWQKVREDFKIK